MGLQSIDQFHSKNDHIDQSYYNREMERPQYYTSRIYPWGNLPVVSPERLFALIYWLGLSILWQRALGQ